MRWRTTSRAKRTSGGNARARRGGGKKEEAFISAEIGDVRARRRHFGYRRALLFSLPGMRRVAPAGRRRLGCGGDAEYENAELIRLRYPTLLQEGMRCRDGAGPGWHHKKRRARIKCEC
jgi:hypothetical protein